MWNIKSAVSSIILSLLSELNSTIVSHNSSITFWEIWSFPLDIRLETYDFSLGLFFLSSIILNMSEKILGFCQTNFFNSDWWKQEFLPVWQEGPEGSAWIL